MTPKVKPGDKITTTVKLSKESDVRFDVLRGMTIILRTLPGVFEYREEYVVKPADGDIQYSWTFLFGTDEGEYTIELAVNGEDKCGGAAQAVNGRGPYAGDCLFENGPQAPQP